METSGQFLKSRLGLSHLKYVMMSRVLISTYKTYIVFYDSRRPSFPITTKRALKSDHLAMLFTYPFESEPIFLPLLDIEEYNGQLNPAMFFVVDMSGTYGDSKNKVDLKRESTTIFYGSLKEYITLSDLKGQDILGDITKRTRSQRNRAVGSENKTAKLVDVDINTIKDHVTFIFKTTATVPIYPKGTTFGKVDPVSKKINRNPDKEYELHIRLLDFFQWLNAQKLEDQTLKSSDIKEVLEVSNVQVFSTSPSFHWQGGNFNISQLDGSIYPTNIAPTVWQTRQGRDDYLLDKHIFGLVQQMPFFLNPMASMLTKRLQDRDLL